MGNVVQLPLNAISLESNPLEPEFPAGISNALRILSRPPLLTSASGFGARGEPQSPTQISKRSHSLPPKSREPALPERGALSEGDADGEEYAHVVASAMDRRTRMDIRRRFEEECTVLSRRLEARSRRRRRPRALWEDERLDSRGLGSQHAYAPFFFQRPSSPSTGGSSRGSGNGLVHTIPVGAIPDMSLEFGFGPPVPASCRDRGSDPRFSDESVADRNAGRSVDAQLDLPGGGRNLHAIPDRSAECGFGPPPRDTTPYFSGAGPGSDSDPEIDSNHDASSEGLGPEGNLGSQAALDMREMELFQGSQELGDFDEMLWATTTKERLCLWEMRESQAGDDPASNGAWPREAFAEWEATSHAQNLGQRAQSF